MAAPALSRETILAKVDELPTLPAIVYELSQVIADPMSSVADVEKLMHNDQSLTTRVLKLVNSAYYAIPGGVSNLGRAIGYIGFDTVHQLVLSASIIKALEVKGPTKFDLNQFWTHSVGVGVASETLAKIVGHKMPSDLFTAGLVHDMGKVALYMIGQESLLTIIEHAKTKSMTFYEAEKDLGYLPHAEIGFLLAEKWRLPVQIQSVIKFHHQTDASLRSFATAETNLNIDLVLLANLLVHSLKFGNSGYEKIAGAPKDVVSRLSLSQEKFIEAVKTIKANLEKASDFVRVLGG